MRCIQPYDVRNEVEYAVAAQGLIPLTHRELVAAGNDFSEKRFGLRLR